MWKNYARDYLKNNRAAGWSVMVAAFIAALFLSFLCSLFYNFWLDGVRESEKEMPLFLTAFYLTILALMCLSLILVIHNAFAVSMNSRIRQFGIFSSIGATPGQIRTCLMQEAFALTAVPALTGAVSGILLAAIVIWAMGAFAAKIPGGRRVDFTLHPAVLPGIFLTVFLTVLVSAEIPARKLSRLTPLEAIRGTGERELKKGKYYPILSGLFGAEGELAGNALRAQKKELRTTSVSLILAFSGFMLMQCFFTLSSISTNHTYFERYQNAWDIMITVKDADIETFKPVSAIQDLREMNSVVYQKAEAVSVIPADAVSPEVAALGGLERLAGNTLQTGENIYRVKTPIVIMDDKSFAEYCMQIGVSPEVSGTILLNRIWDSINSNFRYPQYLPYIKGGMEKITLRNSGTAEDAARGAEVTEVEIPVLACTMEVPILREEYEDSDYPLVQFIPVSLWKELESGIGGAEENLYIQVLAEGQNSAESLAVVEKEIKQTIGAEYETESENRIQEKTDNDRMIKGYKTVLGGLCALLAVIGVAHVFSNTLGFLRQRKREFARYMSVGLTPEGMRKIFCIEAAAVVGRPTLTALILTTLAVTYMIKISYMDPMEFIKAAPVFPILLFVLTVFAFTALAYYLGARKMFQVTLADALRDDTML